MDLELENKIVIVTGGAKSIGYGIVKQLTKEGALPIIIGRNNSDNQLVVDEIRAKKLNADHFVNELTIAEECRRVVAGVIERYGRIDGLVNNAGLNDSVSLEAGKYEDFVKSLQNSPIHYYLVAHHALPELKKSKGPILNISSKVAESGQANTSGYAAANGGRNALAVMFILTGHYLINKQYI